MKPCFVWVYWKEGAEGNEINYSIRSVQKFIPSADIVVCGDRPDGYKGKFIRCPRISQRPFIQWHDSIQKLLAIIESELVAERFCWMYDDTYFLKPTTIDDIAKPRAWASMAQQMNRQPKTSWQAVKQETARLLYGERMPMFDFATHYPTVFEKSRLRETIERFDCHLRPVIIENLYLNHHLASLLDQCGLQKPIQPTDFIYLQRPAETVSRIVQLTENKTCLNNGHRAYNSALRLFLAKLFP